MPIEVKIPTVGESITSGVVSVWHKKSGEFVNEGEPLFTLETEKVSSEIVAEKSGVLETKVPEGQEVKIGEVVAIIDDSKSAPAQSAAPEKKESPTVAAGADRGSSASAIRSRAGKTGVNAPGYSYNSVARGAPYCRRGTFAAGENFRNRQGWPANERRCPWGDRKPRV